jgi:DNA-binding transcriptional ArsR family regulator
MKNISSKRTAANLKEEAVAVSAKFTPIPKTYELMAAGVPPQVVATYAALADYAHNTTGLAWPRMDTLARTLGRTPRTIQYHLHLLKERGLIEFVERRRDRKGRFLSWVYRIAHVAAAAERIRERREKGGLSGAKTKATGVSRAEKTGAILKKAHHRKFLSYGL